jgi:hypothetical protein
MIYFFVQDAGRLPCPYIYFNNTIPRTEILYTIKECEKWELRVPSDRASKKDDTERGRISSIYKAAATRKRKTREKQTVQSKGERTKRTRRTASKLGRLD